MHAALRRQFRAALTSAITVYGAGGQTRSFCYVSDLIEGFVRRMASDHGSAPINLGNPREIAAGELARQIKSLVGSRSPIVEKPIPVDDPCRRKPDITQARDILGWQPTVSLTEGLGRTIEYFKRLEGKAEGQEKREGIALSA